MNFWQLLNFQWVLDPESNATVQGKGMGWVSGVLSKLTCIPRMYHVHHACVWGARKEYHMPCFAILCLILLRQILLLNTEFPSFQLTDPPGPTAHHQPSTKVSNRGRHTQLLDGFWEAKISSAVCTSSSYTLSHRIHVWEFNFYAPRT